MSIYKAIAITKLQALVFFIIGLSLGYVIDPDDWPGTIESVKTSPEFQEAVLADPDFQRAIRHAGNSDEAYIALQQLMVILIDEVSDEAADELRALRASMHGNDLYGSIQPDLLPGTTRVRRIIMEEALRKAHKEIVDGQSETN